MPKQLAVILLLLSPSLASADLVSPPPTNCVDGAVGRTGRIGIWCEPTVCGTEGSACPDQPFCPTRDYPCSAPEPWACSEAPIGLCVRTDTRIEPPHGLGDTGGGREIEVQVAVGPCDDDGACAPGATCETERRCLHATPAEEPAPVPEESGGDTPAEDPAEEMTPVAEPTGGCGCSAATSAAPSWGWALLALCLLRRRRE